MRFSILLFLLSVCLNAFASKQNNQKQLIVLASPRATDKYYASKYDAILDFQLQYAQKIALHDDVAILVDQKSYDFFSKKDPKIKLIKRPMEDIWMRDFSSVFPDESIQFKYTAAAQNGSQKEANFVQKKFNDFLGKNKETLFKTKYKLDGGNAVYTKNKVIVTDRFLEDNALTYSKAKNVLKELLKVDQVAIVPSDDPKGLAHADGMVSFTDENTLFVNRYEGGFRNRVLQKLKDSFTGIKIIEVPYKSDSKVWDSQISSACGINLNTLVTDRAVYVPTFRNSIDAKVLEKIRKNTKKAVVPIDASKVCIMGGSARCLTWQIRGSLAEAILGFVERPAKTQKTQ